MKKEHLKINFLRFGPSEDTRFLNMKLKYME